MENKQMKCIKGESCLLCGSNYCRFVDELDQLKAKNEELKINNAQFIKDNEFLAKRNSKLKAENEELIRRITKIFACLINANRIDKIVDTLLVDDITTLWDYIALTLGIEGDQTQVEEQILQKISECEMENDNK